MQIGACPSCTRPYSASEVAGYGILRPRPAQKGGPIMEFDCPGCGRRLLLVPHGEGRYAPPGEPPPPPPSEAERAPPWARGRRARPKQAARRTAPEREPVEAPRVEIPDPEPAPDPEPDRTPADDDGEMTLSRALEILEVPATASAAEIDRAFRERSRTCHPDKVAHLDSDFQALAEKKFKALKAAYDLLRT